MVENSHAFAAIRGVQAGREYYVTMLPLRVIPKLFPFEDADLPAELRAQRLLNKARVPEIARYLADNPRGYTLPSLTASVDGKVRFEPLGDAGPAKSVGRLTIPMAARFLINDGQHRRAAIEAALKERPELGEENISVLFFVDAGLKRSQQIFADLNRHVVRPSQSLSVLYDHRDPVAQVTCRVVARVPVFKALTEPERSTIPTRSNKLFTLNGIYRANHYLLGAPAQATATDGDEDRLVTFWTAVAEHIPDWGLAAQRRVTCAELRRDYVHAHGVVLEAIGIAASALLAGTAAGYVDALAGLKSLDWSRSRSDVWEGVATVDGRISKAHVHVARTAELFKRLFGLDAHRSRPVTGRKVSARRRAA